MSKGKKFNRSLPVIPVQVYDNLPEPLKSACKLIKPGRQRDIFFLSLLTVQSGIYHNLYGLYRGEIVYPHLYGFVLGPPASGKGVSKHGKIPGFIIDRDLKETFRQEIRDYRIWLDENKKSKNKKELFESEEYKEEPIQKLLFISGNTSSAALIQILAANPTVIIHEAEADTVAIVLSKEWGNYSDILRKSFQHEHVGSNRKTNSELNDVEEPKLAVFLTGTPSQINLLIKSVEDGLFSRFFYYVLTEVEPFESPFKETISIKDKLNAIPGYVLTMDTYNKAFPQFKLYEKDEKKLINILKNWDGEVPKYYPTEAHSTIRRLGLIGFRILMILAVNRDPRQLRYTDADFKSMITILKVLRKHAIWMLSNLGGDEKAIDQYFIYLPHEFETKQALATAKINDIPESSAYKYLNRLTMIGKLKKVVHGKYRKR